MLNGAIGGIAAVSAGCTVYEPWVGVVVGVVAGLLVPAGHALAARWRLDDVTDSFVTHGLCGMLGIALVGAFAKPAFMADNRGGFVYGDSWFASGEADAKLFGWQLFGIVVLFVWYASMSCFAVR